MVNQLSAALEGMTDFTRAELVKLGAHMSKDDRKLKYFFALDADNMIEFVKQELNEISLHPYVPNFNF